MNPTLVVTDASPLITLALADALDLLLMPRWPIAVPDAVYREAAEPRFADGRKIAAWINAYADNVRIEPTNKGIEQSALWSLGMPARDFGELAALEVCDRHLRRSRDEVAILLYEDNDLNLLRPAISPRIKLLTTRSFLTALEANGRIQSTTAVFAAAEDAGRKARDARDLAVDPDLAEALNARLDNIYGSR